MISSRAVLFGLCLVAAVGGTGLGSWQLSRLATRRAHNRRAIQESANERVDLTQSPLVGPVSYRRVTIRGVYDWTGEFVLRGRLLQGGPGVQIITPLRLAGRDSAWLINRGFVPTADAGAPLDPTSYREPDTALIDGIAVDLPNQGDGQPVHTDRGETWHRLDRTAMRSRLAYPIQPYIVIAVADTTKTREHTLRGRVLPIRIDPPALDDGPHLWYAIQWFLIAGAALGFGLVFVRRDPRQGASVVPAISSAVD